MIMRIFVFIRTPSEQSIVYLLVEPIYLTQTGSQSLCVSSLMLWPWLPSRFMTQICLSAALSRLVQYTIWEPSVENDGCLYRSPLLCVRRGLSLVVRSYK